MIDLSIVQSVNVDLKDNFILFRHQGDDSIIYQTKRNIFEEETGLTISNPDIGIPAYVISLARYGSSIRCGHIMDNILGYLKNSNLENILLIIDFDGVIEVSGNFVEQYVKFILSTKSKTISINQNTNINNAISQYVESIIDIQEVTD